jgi:hypothetical protein
VLPAATREVALKYPWHRRRNPAVKTTPLAFVFRSHLSAWYRIEGTTQKGLSASAVKVLDLLREWGASFFDDLHQQSGLLKTQLENALGGLVAWGLVNSDQFHGLRAMITPDKRRKQSRRRSVRQAPLASGGRWSLIRVPINHEGESQRNEQIAHTLLTCYGVCTGNCSIVRVVYPRGVTCSIVIGALRRGERSGAAALCRDSPGSTSHYPRQ